MAKTITIRLGEDDHEIKQQICQLRAHDDPENPYYRRSESEIAKMILKGPLIGGSRKDLWR
ncbi:hypothetical protein [Candidatus Thiosymbion oneisti]|uniref:hypothetical protein n=1 Tax=Candidatus Thiosymbion oneisti TaxID=589554 RepID=UPI0013FD8AF2|nr:hypothetical protein [Candidatus Thiosymbion oneisti]